MDGNVSFLLIHDLNLHCINIYLPLLPITTKYESKKLIKSEKKEENFPLPTLSYNRENRELKINYITNKPNIERKNYICFNLHTAVNENNLNLQYSDKGYLHVKTNVLDFSTSSTLKDKIETIFPTVDELNINFYRLGICCRSCGSCIIKDNILTKVAEGTNTPWSEIVDSLTCVDM